MSGRLALGVALGVLVGLGNHALAAPPMAASDSFSWLSTGDSFASGEGVSGSGVGADYCAQSLKAYGPRALALLQTQRSFPAATSAFSACTGHLTGDFYNEHQVAEGVGSGKGSLWEWTEDQVGAGQTFDVVTFSFGGNDVEFAALIKDCIDFEVPPDSWQQFLTGPDGCRPTEAELIARVDALVAGDPSDPLAMEYGPANEPLTMAEFYALIAQTHLKPGGVLVVVGYPRLIAPAEDWPAWRGSICQRVWDYDADMLGTVTQHLDTRLREAVVSGREQLTDNRRIEYVSRLEMFDADEGHSLCTPTAAEWLNGISVGSSAGIRPEHSFHPNERGHQRTAEVVAELVDTTIDISGPETEASPTAPTAAPPPIVDPEPDFEVGAEFDADCVNAWPTAPTYTTSSIILTMSCPSVPGQFLFVKVTYPDPDLPITPSTGMVRVHGQIVDVARSAYGFTSLIVEADQIDIP